LPIFEDVASVCHALPGISSADMAGGIAALLADQRALADFRDRQGAWVKACSWPVLSARLNNLISSELHARTERYRTMATPPGI
jgi:hypothetical protein